MPMDESKCAGALSGAALHRACIMKPTATLRVQSVLFNNTPHDVEMALASTARATELAVSGGALGGVEVAFGDCSPTPCLSEEQMNDFRRKFPQFLHIHYYFFNANLGSALGHNRLLDTCETDLAMTLNPDVRMSPRALQYLAEPFARGGVGVTEGRQLPIEHPKDFNRVTGETCWASTACAMFPMGLARKLRGFDNETFFLYCDDVDFSWRVRLEGLKVLYLPSATVFHDKRLDRNGGWISGGAERYFSAEAGLLLPWKWSRPDLTRNYLDYFDREGDEPMRRAAAEFRRREQAGSLPVPVDANHRVGEFIGLAYARHRFAI